MPLAGFVAGTVEPDEEPSGEERALGLACSLGRAGGESSSSMLAFAVASVSARESSSSLKVASEVEEAATRLENPSILSTSGAVESSGEIFAFGWKVLFLTRFCWKTRSFRVLRGATGMLVEVLRSESIVASGSLVSESLLVVCCSLSVDSDSSRSHRSFSNTSSDRRSWAKPRGCGDLFPSGVGVGSGFMVLAGGG